MLTAARSGQGSRSVRSLDGEDRCGITGSRQAAAAPLYCSGRSRLLTPYSARALQQWRTAGASFAPVVCLNPLEGVGGELKKPKPARLPVDIKARYRKRRYMRIGWVRASSKKCSGTWKTQGPRPTWPPAATRITRGYVNRQFARGLCQPAGRLIHEMLCPAQGRR